ncbi:MAG: hypothetical protein JNM13_08890 [Hyphomicrobiaceae bacterium]|nr:hypothetical protein [Hyphomicrobiaceae bacterium]
MESATDQPQVPTMPSADEVRAALDRIGVSPAFVGSPQLMSFLRYVCEARLADKHDRIKGYTIAIEALGRDESFDPQTDPIVRVEATRLRRSLVSFYASEAGLAETVIIDIPKGSYVPQFRYPARAVEAVAEPVGEPAETGVAASDAGGIEAGAGVAAAADIATETPPIWRNIAIALAVCLVVLALLTRPTWLGFPDPAEEIARDLLPSISIGNLEHGSDTSSADVKPFAEMLKATLARFGQIRVITAETGETADYTVRGLISGDATEVIATVRLVHRRSTEIVWSSTKREFVGQQRREDVMRGMIGQIATAVGQPYGVVHADLLSRLLSPSSDTHKRGYEDQYRCFLSAYEYWRTYRREQHLATRNCLEQTTRRLPGLAAAHALLSYFYLDEYRLGYNPVPGAAPALDRALASAQRAINLDPENAISLQALLGSLFTRGDFDESRRVAERVLVRNPYDTAVMADVGAKFVVMNDIKRGRDLLRKAAEFNPATPTWHLFFLFLAEWMLDDEKAAARYAVRIDAPDYLLGDVAKLLSADALGQSEERNVMVREMAAKQSDFIARPYDMMLRNIPNPTIAERLFEDMIAAGVPLRRPPYSR